MLHEIEKKKVQNRQREEKKIKIKIKQIPHHIAGIVEEDKNQKLICSHLSYQVHQYENTHDLVNTLFV